MYSLNDLATDVQRVTQANDDYRMIVGSVTPLLRRWMASPDLTEEQRFPCEGRACGHLLHQADDGSFFIISVVFPEGTSSGVHYHGSWGVIGVLSGVDEETVYRREDGDAEPSAEQDCELREEAKDLYPAGSITHLLPPERGFHRVRAAGAETGVSLHILGGTPDTHTHFLCHPETRKFVNFPMSALLDRVPPSVLPAAAGAIPGRSVFQKPFPA
jgi:3-mercaptopropionate dioxygenase